jgi:hypothetical protein
MYSKSVLIAGAVVLAGCLFATTAYAEEPPPAGPPPMPVGPPPAPDMAPPPPMRVAPPPPASNVVVTPAPTYGPTYYSTPCAPAPTPCAPCDPCAPLPCFQLRDECGWPADCNGCPLGRFEIALQGTYTFITDPEHAFGLDTFFPNQLRWDTLDYDGEFGGRVALRYAMTPCDRIEARGAYLGEFSDSTRQTGVFGFSPFGVPPPIPAVAPGVAGPFTADFEMESTLWTAELNWWSEQICDGRWRLDTVVGARVISYEEDADARNFAPAFNPGFPGAPFIRSETENLFIGIQAGGQAHWDIAQTFELNASFKAMLGNINRESVVSDNSIFSGGPHTGTLEEDEIVWGFEAEAGVRWRLVRWLSIEAGYSLLFLDEVQRANDALNFNASPSGALQAQSLTDQIVAHTLFAGITLQF